MKKRRIFIAINFPEGVKKKLSSFQKNWPTLPCRWQTKENLHLTLAFLGYLREEEITEVFKLTEKVASRYQPFSISLRKVSYGPGERLPPRLVWIEGKRSEPLLKLKKDLERFLTEKIHYKPENREFLPHITLGRIRKWEWKKIEPDERPEVKMGVSIDFSINSIEIMESHLKRTGAEYEILKSFSLPL